MPIVMLRLKTAEVFSRSNGRWGVTHGLSVSRNFMYSGCLIGQESRSLDRYSSETRYEDH